MNIREYVRQELARKLHSREAGDDLTESVAWCLKTVQQLKLSMQYLENMSGSDRRIARYQGELRGYVGSLKDMEYMLNQILGYGE